MTEEKYKRINILIRHDQYQELTNKELSLSGLVRDLIDDRFSDTKIILKVSPRAKKLYDLIISNFGVGDDEFESFLIDALDRFLIKRSSELEKLRKELKK